MTFMSLSKLFRLRFKFILCLTFVSAFVTGAAAQINEGETGVPLPKTSITKPNIVFIFADDLGFGDIGVFGAKDVKTPNIDSMATNGMMFPQFYSISPVCTPARAGLLTGRYPIRMGIHHVFFPGSYKGLPEEELTIAEILKAEGYATAIFGKWHLGHRPDYLPLNHGFDEFFGIPYSNDMAPLPMMSGNDFIADSVDQTQLTRDLTDKAIDFIERKKGEPFFLYIPHPMPHVPLYRSERFEGVSARGLYGDVIEELDASVGDIITALKEAGILNNTLLVFTSDNGPWILMGKDGGSSGPLRNGKGTTFEGGMRVPALMMYPDMIRPGRQYDGPATLLDFLPTFVELAGAKLPHDLVVDGHSLIPVFKDDKALEEPERPIAYYSHGRLEAFRMGDWKLKRAYDGQNNPVPSFLRPFMKGEAALGTHDKMLFNLEEDIGETRNLAKKHPEKIEELEAAIKKFEAALGETRPSITPVALGLSPAFNVLFGAVFKFALMVLSGLIFVIAIAAFWLGRKTA